MKKIIIPLLLLCINISVAQKTDSNSIYHSLADNNIENIFCKDFTSMADDLTSIGTRPLKFTSKEWIKLGIIAGAAGLLMTQDKNINELVLKSTSQSMNTIVKAGEWYGSINSAIVFPLGFYLTGLISGNGEIRTTGRILFESLLFSGLTVQVIKIISGRARPYNDKGPFYFNPFNLDNDYNSFPSGHTVIAFSISSVLAARIKNTYASIGLYTLASLTAYQRIYSLNHWFSDTFLAAVIGIVVGNSLVSLNESENPDEDTKLNFSISPNLNQQNGMGILVQFRF